MQFTPEFLEFLKTNVAALSHLVEVAKEFYKIQGEPVEVGENPAAGPEEFEIGGTPKFETVGLTHEDLDALARGHAEAVVKEKALAWVKGFLTGVTMGM